MDDLRPLNIAHDRLANNSLSIFAVPALIAVCCVMTFFLPSQFVCLRRTAQLSTFAGSHSHRLTGSIINVIPASSPLSLTLEFADLKTVNVFLSGTLNITTT
jgi:hypothetical protein